MTEPIPGDDAGVLADPVVEDTIVEEAIVEELVVDPETGEVVGAAVAVEGTVVEGVDVVDVPRAGDPGADVDAATDDRLERIDESPAAVVEALPFTMSAREHFAAVAAVEATGDARVDAATARLDEVAELPTADHVEVYEDVHHRLQDALSEAEVR